jgi:hypothetical protein
MDFESVNQGQTTQWPKEKNTKGQTTIYKILLRKRSRNTNPTKSVGKLR